MNSKKAFERIERLKRRAEWLRSQSDSTRSDISHTRAELSALDWAIPILEDYAKILRENEAKDV